MGKAKIDKLAKVEMIKWVKCIRVKCVVFFKVKWAINCISR